MNVCMPGYCICDAAEYEGDSHCNTYYGRPEERDIRAEEERLERERLFEVVTVTRTRWVPNVGINKGQLPQFKHNLMPGGVVATDSQIEYVERLLESKIIPYESRLKISRALPRLPARSVSRVIEYLKSLPYRTKPEAYTTTVTVRRDEEYRSRKTSRSYYEEYDEYDYEPMPSWAY